MFLNNTLKVVFALPPFSFLVLRPKKICNCILLAIKKKIMLPALVPVASPVVSLACTVAQLAAINTA